MDLPIKAHPGALDALRKLADAGVHVANIPLAEEAQRANQHSKADKLFRKAQKSRDRKCQVVARDFREQNRRKRQKP